MIRWLTGKRDKENPKTWLVTLDRTLFSTKPSQDGGGGYRVAITLDALLQWMAPVVFRNEEQDDFAAMFAEAVRYQLLPQTTVFELRDFLIFEELSIECGNLPAEDVERCINEVKARVDDADPTDPKGRELIAYEVRKFFSEPGRKYKDTLAKLESERLHESRRHKDEVAGLTRTLEAKDETISEWESKSVNLAGQLSDSKLRQSALTRAVASLPLLLVLLASSIGAAHYWGEGENTYQRLADAWHIVLASFAAYLACFYRLLGADRLRALRSLGTEIRDGIE